MGRRKKYDPRGMVTHCGWGVKAGMVHVWVAGKTVITKSHITITITMRYLYSTPYRIGQRR